ncbi:Putative S-adenosyl-L-methionine-dependent methyltransferase [Morus notabilis]|uniref:Putative S-adenosyl-L-methionine-dependent methyltransferase n=1 Tax=Morus notabilis TaxID=981085 RepID=W9R0Z8_9ROSA|nr:Putative S-adenosyl-L-methionine-dependent methyltransferase [Morus notabilis]
MECFVGFRYIPSTLISRPISINYNAFKRSAKTGKLRAKLDDENDPLLQAAVSAVSLQPIFLDPYAGCFVPHHIDIDKKQCSLHYLLATKFIDDKLLDIVNQIDGLKQVVLLTDGMDTRPYRLSWPTSTIMFDVSPDRIFKTAAEKLEDVGAKMPKGCLFRHVPLESSNLQQSLRAKGFNGNLPSVWAIQGLPLMTLSSFEEILLLVSGLATNGCFFLGELPAWLAETDTAIKYGIREWMEKVFMSNGFRVNMISHDEVARSLGKSLTPENYNNMLFLAEQLRFSDDQMETWRREFQRVEEEGDEEGFEEL